MTAQERTNVMIAYFLGMMIAFGTVGFAGYRSSLASHAMQIPHGSFSALSVLR